MPERRSGYKGTLAKPIPYIAPPSEKMTLGMVLRGGTPEDHARAIEERWNNYHTEVARRMTAKLPALFRHHGVPEGDFLALALRMAAEHVPGFRMAKAPVSARKRWNDFDTALLRLHVDEVRANNARLSNAGAAGVVARTGLWGRASAETLKRRAARADARTVSLLRNGFNYQRQVGENKSIADFVRLWKGSSVGSNKSIADFVRFWKNVPD